MTEKYCGFVIVPLTKLCYSYVIGLYGRKIHPDYFNQQIPKIPEVILCLLPYRKRDMKMES